MWRFHSCSPQHVASRISVDVLPSRDCILMHGKSHFQAVQAPLLNIQTWENDIPINIPLNPLEHCHRNEEVEFAWNCTYDFVSEGKGDFTGSDVEFPIYQDFKCASSFLRTFQGNQLSFAKGYMIIYGVHSVITILMMLGMVLYCL